MKNYWMLAGLFMTLIFFACNKDTSDVSPPKLSVYLTDGPADLEAVNIEIIDVQINPDDESGGWRSLSSVHTGTYDLLMLTGGIDTLLGEAEVPEGRLQQIRLVLGDGNSVKVDGQTQRLDTPSAQQSGLKVQIKQDLEPGITYKLLLDFDAGRSVVKAGNSGKFLLKPVLRANLEALTGSIRGQINPDDVQTLVTAFNEIDTVSAFTNEEGMFLLRGVPEGAYQLLITPEESSGFVEKTIDGVNVEINQSTDVGTIDLMN